ncbi:MAG: MFS transporter [Gammaproteobacteria bacterium]|jgi:MFS family permease|nr:MFS transporter [Gammaproteobacteria bacterium]
MTTVAMTAVERRAVASLASIYGLRMLGFFLVLPVLALYASALPGSTPFLVGLAIGIYGLTQACLQIPLGILSDHIGRKRVITAGLLVFAAGSLLAATASDITWLVVGRAIQGSGAIAAATLALLADLTREETRARSMAMVGITIGAAFLLSLVAGPPLGLWIGVDGIFALTAVIAVLAIGLLWRVVPNPTRAVSDGHWRGRLAAVWGNGQLRRLDAGAFVLHGVLTALFVVLPQELAHAGLPAEKHWQLYLPVVLASVVGVAPLAMARDSARFLKNFFALAICALALAELLLAVGGGLWQMAIGVWVFFVGFNVCEALLPSLVSRLAPVDARGAASGVYNTFHFLGSFTGGVAGGLLYGALGASGVFAVCAGALMVWLLIVVRAPSWRLLRTQVLRVGPCSGEEAQRLARRLLAVPGVEEAVVLGPEGVAWLKVEQTVDIESLHDLP